jgi:diaminopimelate decarboxylase
LKPFDDAFALLPISARRVPMATRSRTSISAVARNSLSRGQRAAAASEAYAAMVKHATRDLGCTLIFEPGRLIVKCRIRSRASSS